MDPRPILIFVFTIFLSTSGQRRARAQTPPEWLRNPKISSKIRTDPGTLTSASIDFGLIVNATPAAVFFPSTNSDISLLLRLSNRSPKPFKVAPRGQGHSVRGQAAARNGVVVNMSSLCDVSDRCIRVTTSKDGHFSPYVDVGGEQLWIDVLNETLKYGLAPKSWTDYLYLTVGGTLSNAGISGQAFRHGPQISNVFELDVITGNGKIKKCSKKLNSDLFFAVLGGLGQFGVITRARIALEPAPKRLTSVRLIYTNFKDFSKDQEYLTRIKGKSWSKSEGFDFIEGSVFLDTSPTSSWRPFFSPENATRIDALINKYGPVYSLDAAMYYDFDPEDVDRLLQKLRFAPGMVFRADVSYWSFLNRVREEELALKSLGLWNVQHPWLSLFIPGSRILDFDSGVFKGILRRIPQKGPILVYPLIRDRWDDRTSAVIPEEPVFYSVTLLTLSVENDLAGLEKQNERVLRYCKDNGIEFIQYLPSYRKKEDWVKHFGEKWEVFLKRKRRYDPRMILSPGQGIFASLGF